MTKIKGKLRTIIKNVKRVAASLSEKEVQCLYALTQNPQILPMLLVNYPPVCINAPIATEALVMETIKPNPETISNVAREAALVRGSLSTTEKKTTAEIVAATKLPTKLVKEALGRLRKVNQVVFEGHGRSVRYYLPSY